VDPREVLDELENLLSPTGAVKGTEEAETIAL